MRSIIIILAAGLTAACALAGQARADVTYTFVPTEIDIGTGWQPYGSTFPVGSGCGSGNATCYAAPAPGDYAGYSLNISLTFTDAVVARGSTSFCGSDLTGCEAQPVSGLVSETGLDDNGLFDTNGAFDFDFNSDGTLSGGSITNALCPSSAFVSCPATYGVGGVALSGTGDDWSGIAGNVTPDFQPFPVEGYWIDAADIDPPADPPSIPAPSSLALLTTALGLFFLANRQSRRARC